MSRLFSTAALSIFVAMFSLALEAQQVQVQGLFKGSAVLTIDGRQQLLKEGQVGDAGVRLVSASPKQAVVEINGERRELGLSQRISSSYSVADRSEVKIHRDQHNRYPTFVTINGRRVSAIVDTGATQVAMSERHARTLDLPYTSGEQGRVSTASGLAKAYYLTLNSVAIGDLKVSGVEALVIEGDYPREVLIGVSYLRHVEFAERGGTMTLKSKF